MTLLEKKRGNIGLMPSLRSNFDELFDIERFFDDPGLRLSRLNKIPATNIRELDKEFIVELAAPGLNKKDFQVDVDNNLLEIKVEKQEENTMDREKFTRHEFDFQAFYRSFSIPENVISNKIKAEYKNGMLMVHLPKTEDSKNKPVKVITVD